MFGFHLSYKWLYFTAPSSDAPIPRPPPGLERHFISTPSGRIEVLSASPTNISESDANTKSTPILFIHGGMGSAWVWTEYMQYLAERGITSYAVSMRGHGNSWCPSYLRMCFFTPRQRLADDVLAALTYVEDKHGSKVLLVGHSSGGGMIQGILDAGQAKAKGMALLGAVPCFGSLGVYRNWAKADPWFSIRMILHLWHPNSPLSHPVLVRRIFFTDQLPEPQLMEFWKHGSRYESYLWPFSMMSNFASPINILKSILGGDKGGDKVMVMTGTKDTIMSQDIMRDLGERYRSAVGRLGGDKKVDDRETEGVSLDGEGGEDNTASGVRVTWVPEAGHHLQNDVMWEIGARKLLEFYEQL